MTLSRSILSALFAVILSACAGASDAPSTSTHTEDRPLLVIITSPDSETQLMALVLTNSARAKGESPRLLLCSAGADIALSDPPARALAPLQPKGASPQSLLKKLISDGVPVDVCAIYLPNRSFGPEALIAGVGVATPDAMGEFIAQPSAKIMSF